MGGSGITIAQFLLGLVLARLLSPSDFGEFIAVTSITSVLLLFAQIGMPQTLVRTKELASEQFNAAFWTMTVGAVLTAGAIALVAAPLSRLFDAPHFAHIAYGMCFAFLIIPYNGVAMAILRRRMMFDVAARISVWSFAATVPSTILLAATGFGPFALVAGAIASMLTTSLLVAGATRWRPAKPAFMPIAPLWGYARYAMFNSAMSMLNSRVDNLLVGSRLGVQNLGVYNRAYSLARIPTDQFGEGMFQILFSSLSRVQDDCKQSRDLSSTAIVLISSLTSPFLVVLALCGPGIVGLLYGKEWYGAGEPLQVMAVGGALIVVSITLRGLISAQGLVKQLFGVHAWNLAVTSGVVLGLSPFGLTAVAAGITLKEGVTVFLMTRILRSTAVAFSLAEIGHILAPVVLAAIIAFLAGGLLFTEIGGARDVWLFEAFRLGAMTAFVFGVYLTALVVVALVWTGHGPLQASRALVAGTAREAARTLWERLGRHRGERGNEAAAEVALAFSKPQRCE